MRRISTCLVLVTVAPWQGGCGKGGPRQAELQKALWTAVEHGLPQVTEVLLASGADANAKSSYGQTVLHRAVHSGNPIHHKVAEVLIANGADVDAKDQKQRTPLHCVGHSAAAKLLVDSGCDVDVKDSSGCAPLHYAAMYRNGAIAEVLLAKEADVNLEDKDGRTPLFWATQTEMEFGDVAQVERTAVNIVEVLRKHGGRKAGSWR